ncbi:hypothetical protein ACWHAO_30580 [Streptomyces albidoflavus]
MTTPNVSPDDNRPDLPDTPEPDQSQPEPPGAPPLRPLPHAGLRPTPRSHRPLMTRNLAVTVAALAWTATIAVLTARL